MGNIDMLRRWFSNFRNYFKPEAPREEQSSGGGGGCYGSRKRKYPPEIDLTEDEDEPIRNPYNIIVKKKRVDFRGQEPRPLQQQNLQPFPTSSREFFKDTVMSRKYSTRGSGINPSIPGQKVQPWDFNIPGCNSQRVDPEQIRRERELKWKEEQKRLDHCSADNTILEGKKSISGKEKIPVITIRDSEEEKEEEEVVEVEEEEQGPSTGVHKSLSKRKSIKLHPSSRQIVKSPEKRPLKKGHWGSWFKRQISLNDSFRHNEKANYIKLLKSTAVPPYQSRNSPLYESFGKAKLDQPPLPLRRSILKDEVSTTSLWENSTSSTNVRLYSVGRNSEGSQVHKSIQQLLSEHNFDWNGPLTSSTPYLSSNNSQLKAIEGSSKDSTNSFITSSQSLVLKDSGSSRTDDDEVIILSEKIMREPQKKMSSLELELHSSILFDKDWSKKRSSSYKESHRERKEKIDNEEKTIALLKKESTLDKDLNDRMRRKLKITGIIELEEQMPEIDEEMEKIIENAKSYGPENQVLKTLFNIDITKGDIKTLAPMKWLNDNVINAYMEMIAHRSKGGNYKKCHPFTTFFYPKLLKDGYVSLKRWTRKVDIFSFDLLLFPIHLGLHWCFAVADIPNKTIRYYDSLGGRNNQCLKTLLGYLKSEMKERKQELLDEDEWELENVHDIPQQENGSDCGMFTCKFAEYISRGSDLTFGQENMNYFRKRMIYELVTNNLLYP